MMRHPFIFGLVCAIIAYFTGSFFNVNFDISLWSDNARLGTIGLWLIMWVSPLALKYLNSDH